MFVKARESEKESVECKNININLANKKIAKNFPFPKECAIRKTLKETCEHENCENEKVFPVLCFFFRQNL